MNSLEPGSAPGQAGQGWQQPGLVGVSLPGQGWHGMDFRLPPRWDSGAGAGRRVIPGCCCVLLLGLVPSDAAQQISRAAPSVL